MSRQQSQERFIMENGPRWAQVISCPWNSINTEAAEELLEQHIEHVRAEFKRAKDHAHGVFGAGDGDWCPENPTAINEALMDRSRRQIEALGGS